MLRVMLQVHRVPRLVIPHVATRSHSSATTDYVLLAPVPPSWYEELIAKTAPVFLEQTSMARCFPPCTTGARMRAFRANALRLLESELSVLALDAHSGEVVGAHVAGPFLHHDLFGADDHALGPEEEDPFHKHRKRFFTAVHRRLNLFSRLGVSQILDMAYMFVEKPYRQHGLTSRLWRACLKLAVQQGFRAMKGESTSAVMHGLMARRRISPVYSVSLKEYTFEGKVIFANAKAPEDILNVYACRLGNVEPFIVPLTE